MPRSRGGRSHTQPWKPGLAFRRKRSGKAYLERSPAAHRRREELLGTRGGFMACARRRRRGVVVAALTQFLDRLPGFLVAEPALDLGEKAPLLPGVLRLGEPLLHELELLCRRRNRAGISPLASGLARIGLEGRLVDHQHLLRVELPFQARHGASPARPGGSLSLVPDGPLRGRVFGRALFTV